MIRVLTIILNLVLTSLYFFPFELKAYPGGNSKMMMAVVGLVIFGCRMAQGRNGQMSRSLFWLSLFAAFVSLCGFASVTLNETPDYAYATYLVSMWVWIGGAYAVCNVIKATHGYLDAKLVTHYLVGVCLIQCALALMIDNMSVLKTWVDARIEQGQDFLNQNNVDRLYGIGASLDVAGSRFSAVLVLLAYFIRNAYMEHEGILRKSFYLFSFIAIGVVGNMIARTATVGLFVALMYWIVDSNVLTLHLKQGYRTLFGGMLAALLVAIPVVAVLYQTDPTTRKLLRFAFEGFFSLAEKGSWEVSSNDKLRTMYVFPETIKTWIIGDGYFSSPQNVDPYYTGPIRGGYYMGTDVGYLRFIFYFGTVGLMAFIAFICKATQLCVSRFEKYKVVFLLLMAVNFLVWFKVSTDIFLVFALFLMFPQEEQQTPTVVSQA